MHVRLSSSVFLTAVLCDSRGQESGKLLNPLGILSMEKTMIASWLVNLSLFLYLRVFEKPKSLIPGDKFNKEKTLSAKREKQTRE